MVVGFFCAEICSLLCVLCEDNWIGSEKRGCCASCGLPHNMRQSRHFNPVDIIGFTHRGKLHRKLASVSWVLPKGSSETDPLSYQIVQKVVTDTVNREM